MGTPAPDEVADAASEAACETDIPSCQECRRRKLKCSREQPVCSRCERLDSPCVYDLKKNKPGIKAGAVGSLSRRVEVLEAALEQQSRNQSRHQTEHLNGSSNSSLGSQDVVQILSTLAAELRTLNSRSRPASSPQNRPAVISPAVSQTPSRNSGGRNDDIPYGTPHPRKRRRVDSCGQKSVDISLPLEENLEGVSTSLPAPTILQEVIDIYFEVVQPWIPIMHESQFRRRIQDANQMPQLVVVLHAMVVAALRFVNGPGTRLSASEIEQRMANSRKLVILTSMESLSVESLQALIIVAFNDIGNGQASKAWSVIGSLTRTVEYLQLSVESDHQAKRPLLKPLPTIAEPRDWTEEEQRRRVFWNVFCLDRFCSVTTGWHTSLTSNDVQRRLPADGGLWHNEEGVTTPYFGIWDRSMAKIGNSIAFLPGNYPSSDQTQHTSSMAPPRAGSETRPNDMDMTTVGAFAYRIEATESLSRITTYFLQQKIDFQDRQQVSDWLTRFKELDLRLVHWKMFLPQRWKDSNISRQPALINMDPNLTLAHVTHNTSLIILHQRIAYPDPSWSDSFKLPSLSSAETCQVAAVETTTITQKYLKYTSVDSLLSNQYAFCVFISARVLLVHWRHSNSNLAPEFWVLIASLDDMAKRWSGPTLHHLAAQSLAGKYAQKLRNLHAQCEASGDFTIDVLGYSSEMVKESSPSSPFFPSCTPRNDDDGYRFTDALQQPSEVVENSVGFATNSLHTPAPFLGQPQPRTGDMESLPSHLERPGLTPATDMYPDRLSTISHLLMDESFMAVDRIISLDDMIFANTDGNGNSATWAPGVDGEIG